MFNDRFGLTQAVLEGRKTQIRRIPKTPGNAYGGLEIESNNIILTEARCMLSIKSGTKQHLRR